MICRNRSKEPAGSLWSVRGAVLHYDTSPRLASHLHRCVGTVSVRRFSSLVGRANRGIMDLDRLDYSHAVARQIQPFLVVSISDVSLERTS